MPRTNATTGRAKRGNGSPDALRLLKDDHARVLSMFEELQKAETPSAKETIASTICEELTLHTLLEELIFYPAVRAALEDDEIMNEADVEHASAKALIGRIQECDASDQHFEAMVKVLGESIRHHVKEEEGKMFKQAKSAGVDFEQLGARMRAFKEDQGAGSFSQP